MFLKPGAIKINKNNLVAPTGFEPVFQSRPRFRHVSPILARWSRVRESTRLKHAGCIETRPAQAWPGYCELADQEQLARKRRGFSHPPPSLTRIADGAFSPIGNWPPDR